MLRDGDATLGQHLLFVRTDLRGRLAQDSEVLDPTCVSATTGCYPGPHNVVWTGSEFVVIYFATTDPGSPTPTTEMRMVRLVPGG